jgi:hypothetical protein
MMRKRNNDAEDDRLLGAAIAAVIDESDIYVRQVDRGIGPHNERIRKVQVVEHAEAEIQAVRFRRQDQWPQKGGPSYRNPIARRESRRCSPSARLWPLDYT